MKPALTPALSRKRERELKTPLAGECFLPPLPLAGEGWGEGSPANTTQDTQP